MAVIHYDAAIQRTTYLKFLNKIIFQYIIPKKKIIFNTWHYITEILKIIALRINVITWFLSPTVYSSSKYKDSCSKRRGQATNRRERTELLIKTRSERGNRNGKKKEASAHLQHGE